MSAFTNNHKVRVEKLTNYIFGLIEGRDGTELLAKYQILKTSFLPLDVIIALDNVMQEEKDLEKIKKASNKLFNILYKNLASHNKFVDQKTLFIDSLIKDNAGVKKQLSGARHYIRQINKAPTEEVIEQLKKDFAELQRFTEHYTVMQHIVFPEIEKYTKHHRCLTLMWSYHDDIIRNVRKTIDLLHNPTFDLVLFNQVSSKVYFNISTIIFREENVLFPIMYESFDTATFSKMEQQLKDFKLAFADTSFIEDKQLNRLSYTENAKNNAFILSTGELNTEQLELIFNNLPVDITYVDENDEVKYFSTPRHRIFPRTTGIIGRKVQNCHPHESVHVVNEIVDAFKTGRKEEAAFWIKMGTQYVLITYYALRDKMGRYKGVLEVSQEITEIQNIKGERRLLDW